MGQEEGSRWLQEVRHLAAALLSAWPRARLQGGGLAAYKERTAPDQRVLAEQLWGYFPHFTIFWATQEKPGSKMRLLSIHLPDSLHESE